MLDKGARNGALIYGGGNLRRQGSCRFLVQFSLLDRSKIDTARTCGGGIGVARDDELFPFGDCFCQARPV